MPLFIFLQLPPAPSLSLLLSPQFLQASRGSGTLVYESEPGPATSFTGSQQPLNLDPYLDKREGQRWEEKRWHNDGKDTKLGKDPPGSSVQGWGRVQGSLGGSSSQAGR